MSAGPSPEVFTPDELARASGVPRRAVDLLIASGDLRPVPGTRFFAAADAIRAVPHLRTTALITAPFAAPEPLFALSSVDPGRASGRRIPLLAASSAHGLLLGLVIWLAAGTPGTASADVAPEPVRLVFLMSPGPGGGGGGSGARQTPRPARLERRGRASLTSPVATPAPAPASDAETRDVTPPPAPAPVENAPPPPPLDARTVVAPVVVTASNPRERDGTLDAPAARPPAQGSGSGGNAGAGAGRGTGDGLGSGIGEGAGGGTGGGPYRPGSGIEPPRLLHEVKAEYTEEARRRGLTGAVVLEIVVTREGTVGDVTIRRSLGAGLDERAVAAVRQWRFAPARRQGEPVDVIVEVTVDFTLR